MASGQISAEGVIRQLRAIGKQKVCCRTPHDLNRGLKEGRRGGWRLPTHSRVRPGEEQPSSKGCELMHGRTVGANWRGSACAFGTCTTAHDAVV